jgi:hypothetical protein
VTEQRKTVGAASLEAAQKSVDTRDPIELQRSMQENYINELIECVNKHRKDYTSNFFIVVITKREKLMRNVLRNYFFPRTSCPTPDYDQAVYRYNSEVDDIEYIWCIPDRETCLTLKENALQVTAEERELLQHIMEFSDGTLYRKAKKLNKEADDSSLLIA